MDAFQAYSFISSKSAIISLQWKTDSAAVTSHCDHTVSVFPVQTKSCHAKSELHLYQFYFLNLVALHKSTGLCVHKELCLRNF